MKHTPESPAEDEGVLYWRDLWHRFNLPTFGTWLASPDGDDAPGCWTWVHAETRHTVPVMLSPGETPEQMCAEFSAAVPAATFLLPA